MRDNKEIKCDLCGYQFKTYETTETHYHNYEPKDEKRYYPLAQEKAHLVRNYICDDCYNRIGEIVLQLFIDKGESYNEDLESRKLVLYKKYEAEVAKLVSENEEVLQITNKVKSAKSILDLDEKLSEIYSTAFRILKGLHII